MDKFVTTQPRTSGKRKLELLQFKLEKEDGILSSEAIGSTKKVKVETSEGAAVVKECRWKKIKSHGLDCDYIKLFTKTQADDIFQQLENDVEYFSGDLTKVQVYGKWYNIPRKQVSYGDPELTYRYSGVTLSPKPWIPVMEFIRSRITKVTGHTFNFVLINRYKDGNDHIGEHRDDEKELEQRSPIASVSFGACRDFIFRHGASRGKNATCKIEPVKLQLEHGSLLMMNYPTNVYWYHSLPVRKNIPLPRINLTFRKVVPLKKKS